MHPVIIALMIWCAPTTDTRADECRGIAEAVVVAAEMSDESKWRMAALVVKESGMRVDVVGKLGERGPAQVIPFYVGMSRADVATADGGMLAAVRALAMWKAAEPERYWECYAAGQKCVAKRAMRRLGKVESELRAIHAAWVAAHHLHRIYTLAMLWGSG